MSDDLDDVSLLVWLRDFVWSGWNRMVCAVRGHREEADFCARCGLPL